jgi:CRISPR/Cas system Type II protein with McrA/HNH and RuvC-like nuclease domain
LLVLTTKRAKGMPVNPNEVNIDHIFPRSQGGWNSYGNAQVLSFSENLKKLDQIPDVF